MLVLFNRILNCQFSWRDLSLIQQIFSLYFQFKIFLNSGVLSQFTTNENCYWIFIFIFIFFWVCVVFLYFMCKVVNMLNNYFNFYFQSSHESVEFRSAFFFYVCYIFWGIFFKNMTIFPFVSIQCAFYVQIWNLTEKKNKNTGWIISDGNFQNWNKSF